MAWSKPFTEEEDEYIRTVFPQMRTGAIAQKLGRSPSGVRARIAALGLREEAAILRTRACAHEGEPAKQAQDGTQDTLSMLRELRGVLRCALMDAEPRNIPSISAEYRETLEAIEKIENGGEGGEGGEGGGLAELIGSLAGKLSS